jgi:hypothetical protein
VIEMKLYEVFNLFKEKVRKELDNTDFAMKVMDGKMEKEI